ncbi:hypothetical protein HM1_2752 [Heliomicrobium modesticaldum Ice1]|uniref:JAB1/MPN/MOV34 metalloenzyme domain-containing protein n=1 Tax=Heliobacterium modesticaldum (strain ATCC 51547 / Ice1) TaxID=498761 RepID=B0TC08_HELMI|nr:hypothetical protein [Heliomicrobium modesticaldum]ABZ85281.1 hypothetical protein HM1_2752 [Heliomicrobium modesticaldum Ice1]
MNEEIRVEYLRIEILEKVFNDVGEYVGKCSHEAGGLLLGNVYFQERSGILGALVRVETFLPALHAEPVHTSLKLTQADWEEWERLRKLAPKLQVLGWVHSHLGCGLFFSGQDLTIQQEHFSRPWHIGWVVDPHSGTHGFYRWRKGAMVSTEDWQAIQVTRSARSQPVPLYSRSSPAGKNPSPSSPAHADYPAPSKATPTSAASSSNAPSAPGVVETGYTQSRYDPIENTARLVIADPDVEQDSAAEKGKPVFIINDTAAGSAMPTFSNDRLRGSRDPLKDTPPEARIRSYRREPSWKGAAMTFGMGLLIFLAAALVTVGVYTLWWK